ncbi:MAG TPA: hypothetical protein VGC96_10125 [Candidatus Elarobacter sp.]|jgi:hypothetical protein
MAKDALDALRAAVHADPDLALLLRRTDPEEFFTTVLRVADERGLAVTHEDVHEAVSAGRQAWLTRWLR